MIKNSILFYGWVVFHCIYIVCIYLSIDGNLGCFHILAIIDNAAMNIEVHVSFLISVFFICLYINPGVELLGHMAIFRFLRCLHTLSHSYIYTTNTIQGFVFSTPSWFLCQYHAFDFCNFLVFLKSERVMPSALFFFSALLWHFWVFYGSIYILGLFVQFIWKMSWVIW